jgi:nucleotide-binding universal stress UspA family protein
MSLRNKGVIMLYEKILIPTDSSEVSIEASKHALEIAKAMGSKVYAIYVIDIVPFIGLPTEGLWESMKDILEEEGKDALKKIEENAKKMGVEIKSEILEGNPVKEILDYAERKNVDLIVLGTTGKSGLDKLLLGSVAEKVSKGSHCPVLLVKKNAKNDKNTDEN